MKKIMLLFCAIIVFFMPIQKTYLEVDAAILSKAASATAKKIAKEVVQDAAVNMAINIAADEAKRLNGPSRMVKEGHMLICMDYTYKPGDTCKKPSSIKANLTDVDKANIKTQSGTEIDKLISPDGKGFSKWAKFLDWFAPIWLISFGVGALTYALDPDVQNLFDEAAFNTLQALGLMGPVTLEEAVPLEEQKPIGEPAPETDRTGIQTKSHFATANNTYPLVNVDYEPQNVTVVSTFDSELPASGTFGSWAMTNYALAINGNQLFVITNNTVSTRGPLQNTETIVAHKNGVHVWDGSRSVSSTQTTFTMNFESYGMNVQTKQMESIRTRLPYEIDGKWYTDVLFNTVDGNILTLQLMQSTKPNFGDKISTISSNETHLTNRHQSRITTYPNINPKKQVLIGFQDVEENSIVGDHSSYKDDKGNIALLPPAAFTYIDETTGEQVERVKAPTGDGYVWQKPDGTQVPEDNVVPNPTEEPKITPSPDGTPQYTPAPTPTNPAPEPVPLKPNPTAPPAEPPPGTEPPIDPMPDGPNCAAKLKMPIFSPLKEQLSTSFPFSIPWDIERAAHAAFDGVGNQKPSFDMVIPVGEKIYQAKIETPAFLDKWKPFMDGFLLLTFDMLLMFGLYRFVKGAGS